MCTRCRPTGAEAQQPGFHKNTFTVLSAPALASTLRNSLFQLRPSTASVWLPSFRGFLFFFFFCSVRADTPNQFLYGQVVYRHAGEMQKGKNSKEA